MGAVRGIHTTYAGVTFRSRLEAAWARWFDDNRIEWRYETESYDLDGIWYLPDFWLPKLRTFVEVKGVLDEPGERKVRALAKACEINRHLVVLAFGPAGVNWARVSPDGGLEDHVAPDRCEICDVVQFFGVDGCRVCEKDVSRPWEAPYSAQDWIQIYRWWAQQFARAGLMDEAAETLEHVVHLVDEGARA